MNEFFSFLKEDDIGMTDLLSPCLPGEDTALWGGPGAGFWGNGLSGSLVHPLILVKSFLPETGLGNEPISTFWEALSACRPTE